MTPIWFSADESGPVLEWLAAHLPGCHRGWDAAVALAVFDDGEIVGAVAFHDWVPESGLIALSGYSRNPRWFSKGFLWEVFDYCYNRVGCQMVIMQVSERNTRMLSIAKRFGFDLIRLPRGRGRDEDEIICTLTDDAWRAGKIASRTDGQTKTTAATRPR